MFGKLLRKNAFYIYNEKKFKTGKILKKIKNVQLDTYQSLNIFIDGNTESVYANPWRILPLDETYMERDLECYC
jgi:hypothetical protein